MTWGLRFSRSLKTGHGNGTGTGTCLTFPFETSTNSARTASIALAFEVLTPTEACALFARGVGRPVRYVRGPIDVKVSIPNGYRAQLDALQLLFGEYNAPYFGPDLKAPDEARALWEGHRGLEEYSREVFHVEERANGRTWMDD